MVENLCLSIQETWVRSLGWEDRLGREWQPAPVFWPRESCGQRSLVGYHGVTKSHTRLSVKLRTVSEAVLLGLSTLWVRGKLLPLAPLRASNWEKRNLFFPSLLILSSALAWSYCTYANEAMSAMEANSAIYSWSLATLITAAADFRKPTQTRVRAHTHTHAHTHIRTHAHTLHRVYFFPQDINFPSHCSLGRRMQH